MSFVSSEKIIVVFICISDVFSCSLPIFTGSDIFFYSDQYHRGCCSVLRFLPCPYVANTINTTDTEYMIHMLFDWNWKLHTINVIYDYGKEKRHRNHRWRSNESPTHEVEVNFCDKTTRNAYNFDYLLPVYDLKSFPLRNERHNNIRIYIAMCFVPSNLTCAAISTL